MVYVLAFALVRIELLLDSRLRFRLAAQGLMCWELHIAVFADSQHWNVVRAPDDPEFSLCHAPSLRRSRYDFTGGRDGAAPDGSIVFDAQGNLYGAAKTGGAHGLGVVWEIGP